MRLLLALVLLAGCGPKVLPQPSIHERCQAASRPDICELIGNQVEADAAVAQPQPYLQAPPQRRFIWPYPRVGHPGGYPLGYIDY